MGTEGICGEGEFVGEPIEGDGGRKTFAAVEMAAVPPQCMNVGGELEEVRDIVEADAVRVNGREGGTRGVDGGAIE